MLDFLKRKKSFLSQNWNPKPRDYCPEPYCQCRAKFILENPINNTFFVIMWTLNAHYKYDRKLSLQDKYFILRIWWIILHNRLNNWEESSSSGTLCGYCALAMTLAITNLLITAFQNNSAGVLRYHPQRFLNLNFLLCPGPLFLKISNCFIMWKEFYFSRCYVTWPKYSQFLIFIVLILSVFFSIHWIIPSHISKKSLYPKWREALYRERSIKIISNISLQM